MVVYLQASIDVLMGRNRAARPRVRARYAARLHRVAGRGYNHFFFHYDESPLLVVNTSDIDFVNSREHYDDLRRRIETPFQGVQYYTPSRER
jgi:deoxyadenosine/deoxycytidine kinase